jgi:hypothetical protein
MKLNSMSAQLLSLVLMELWQLIICSPLFYLMPIAFRRADPTNDGIGSYMPFRRHLFRKYLLYFHIAANPSQFDLFDQRGPRGNEFRACQQPHP